MPAGKRASMREGPLAALFRKTSEDLPQEEEKQRGKSRRAASTEREATARAEREAAPAPEPASQVPTPQERLRHAFAADIPNNLLDRSRRLPQDMDVFARPERATSAYARPSLATERRAPNQRCCHQTPLISTNER